MQIFLNLSKESSKILSSIVTVNLLQLSRLVFYPHMHRVFLCYDCMCIYMLCNSWPVPGRGRVQRGRAEEPTSNGAGQVSVLGQRPLPPRIGMLAERGSPWLHASLAVSDSAPGLSSELGRKGHLCHPVSEAVPGLPSRESSGSLPISVKSSSSVCSSLGAQL